MTTAEKLTAIAQKELEAKELNQKLENCLYGADVGGKSWYDEFWDAYQQNGNRTGYAQAFYNSWNDITFKPKYDIICLGNSYGVFGSSKMTAINKVIDISQATNIQTFFIYCDKLITIKKLIVSATTPFWANTFQSCIALENLTIKGVIGTNNFDIHWSTKLTADSLKSIIQALSTTTTGLTITLPTTAQANYEAVYGAGSWETLTASRSNWTIAYA